MTASFSCDLLHGRRTGLRGAGVLAGRGRPGRRAGSGLVAVSASASGGDGVPVGTPTGVPAGTPAGVQADAPKPSRRGSRYFPLANSSRVRSSRITNWSADLFTPTATMVRPLAFFSWHLGAMQ